jgi:hypothetical protein
MYNNLGSPSIRELRILQYLNLPAAVRHTFPTVQTRHLRLYVSNVKHLPPALVAKIMRMRRDSMMADANARSVDGVIASFWERVWRAKPRVFRHRLREAQSHGQP